MSWVASSAYIPLNTWFIWTWKSQQQQQQNAERNETTQSTTIWSSQLRSRNWIHTAHEFNSAMTKLIFYLGYCDLSCSFWCCCRILTRFNWFKWWIPVALALLCDHPAKSHFRNEIDFKWFGNQKQILPIILFSYFIFHIRILFYFIVIYSLLIGVHTSYILKFLLFFIVFINKFRSSDIYNNCNFQIFLNFLQWIAV